MFDKIFKVSWVDPKTALLTGLKEDFFLDGKFLINHTDKIYVDCDQYRYLSDLDETGIIIHPLPLLTYVGGRLDSSVIEGCYDCNDKVIGSWAMCEISVEDIAPTGYTKLSGLFFQAIV